MTAGLSAVTDSELTELVETRRIEQLIASYGLFYDSSDFGRFAALFTPDASYDITPDPDLFPLPVTGRDAIVESMAGRRHLTASTLGASPRHLSTNVLVHDLDGDQARVASFLVVCFAHPDGSYEVRRSGTYVDTVRKTAGIWQFASRHLHLMAVPRLWPDGDAA